MPDDTDHKFCWAAFAKDFHRLGCSYTEDQIRDPDFCARELANLGYALALRVNTYAAVTAQLGHPPATPRDAFEPPPVTYQLWGPLYPEWGAHASPLCPSIAVAAATALFNMQRILAKQKSAGKPH